MEPWSEEDFWEARVNYDRERDWEPEAEWYPDDHDMKLDLQREDELFGPPWWATATEWEW